MVPLVLLVSNQTRGRVFRPDFYDTLFLFITDNANLRENSERSLLIHSFTVVFLNAAC